MHRAYVRMILQELGLNEKELQDFDRLSQEQYELWEHFCWKDYKANWEELGYA